MDWEIVMISEIFVTVIWERWRGNGILDIGVID
jgi:hypothetical protein